LPRFQRIAHEAHRGFTHSGFTARLVSRYRRSFPSSHFSRSRNPAPHVALLGCHFAPHLRHKKKSTASPTRRKAPSRRAPRKKADVIGIVAGHANGIRGTTNFMKFHVIGDCNNRTGNFFQRRTELW